MRTQAHSHDYRLSVSDLHPSSHTLTSPALQTSREKAMDGVAQVMTYEKRYKIDARLLVSCRQIMSEKA